MLSLIDGETLEEADELTLALLLLEILSLTDGEGDDCSIIISNQQGAGQMSTSPIVQSPTVEQSIISTITPFTT
jgi:hypothetical protein